MTVTEKKKTHKLIFVGMLLLSLAVCTAIGAYFWMMSHPAEENIGYSLYPNPTKDFGWSYLVDGVEMEPQFDEMGYLPSFPTDNQVCIIEASRIMSEQRQEGILRFIDSVGIQVYLDGRLLYTDFPEAENHFGVLLPWNAELAAQKGLPLERYVPLPQDYIGKTLTIVSYGMVYDGLAHGCYPELYESGMLQGGLVPSSVLPVAAATVAAVLGLFVLLLFLFGVWHNSVYWSTLLLVLFAFLSMIAFSGESFPVSFAIPGGRTPDVVYFVKAIAIDALLFYFAVQMKKGHGILLSVAATAHILLHAMALVKPHQIYALMQSVTLPLLLLLTLILLILEYKRQALFRLVLQSLIPIGLVFGVFILISPKDSNANAVYLAFTTALSGNWMPLSLLLSTVLSLLSTLLLFVHYVRTQVRQRLEYQAYQMKGTYQQENMENLALALDQAKTARHEYKHHLETLRGLVDDQGGQRAAEYLDSIITQEESDNRVQFSEHPVVNVILSTAYRKAQQLDIEMKSSVTVPEHIGITDVDLSQMMNNMIENAFEAIADMPNDKKRFIHLKIGIVDEYIFYLGCENSYDGLPYESGILPHSTKEDPENHGFGLPAIRRIAEKYRGFLVFSGDGTVSKTQVRLSLSK